MFTHLHVHTEFSLLDGLARIPQLLDRAQSLGQDAIAMTDHGAMYGAIQFYKEARKRGIKPIIGQEFYVAPGHRSSRDTSEKSPFHLTVLARNNQGYKNLIAMSSRAHLEGYYYKPRVDRELLEQYHDGLIVLSGCPSSEIHRALQESRWTDAVGLAGWYREVFGENFYLEIQEHNDPQFSPINVRLAELGRDLEIPLVLTNDSHYTSPEDDSIHDLLLCIGTNSNINDPKRFRIEGGSYYLKSEEEMRALFPELPEASDNTVKIAEGCEINLEFDRLYLPDPELPPGVSPDQHLAQLCWAGAERRYGSLTDQVRQRLEYELMVIGETGFASYILIVKDFSDFARGRGIPMGVRGSAAGSIVLYCTGITDIDPLAYRLVFERFLNLERREMPDIDMDFADDRRDEVIRYVADKYGYDRVAQIITFGTLGAKAAIRDTGRALAMPFADTDRVARLIPTAVNMTIEKALNENAELNQAYSADKSVKDLIDTARRLEGVARHASTHAAGVVISNNPLIEHVPLQQPVRQGNLSVEEGRSIPMTQYGMWDVAEIGLLKMDFLGLSNLTILARALDLVKERRGIEIDLLTIPDGDPETCRMLGRGDTFGVFQLESPGMRRAVVELQPECIADLAALVALYRPGPMQHIGEFCQAKHGQRAVEYPHPDLAEILDETYGIIVYQDQVLLIVQKFAGYTLGEADILRKAMGKKIREIMVRESERFIEGAIKQGYSRQQAQSVFDLIEPFAGYAFNKAHSVCYGAIAYQTAYLKATYPEEYMTAVLMLAGHDRIAAAAAECARLGLRLLPPDLNQSGVTFSIEAGEGQSRGIRFGLGVVKNVGAGAAEALVTARGEEGPFQALEEFCRRAPLAILNKRALESLIKSGAFDELGPRATLNANLDRIMAVAQREQKLKETGQTTMFDLFGSQVDTPMPQLELQPVEVPISELLAWEKELLGVYVSEHPFTRAAQHLGQHITVLCSELAAEASAGDYVVAGALTMVTKRVTRDGRPFAVVEFEDLSGSLELTVWSDVLDLSPGLWIPGQILLCLVRVRDRGDRVQLSIQKAIPYDAQAEELRGFDPSEWTVRRTKRPTPPDEPGRGVLHPPSPSGDISPPLSPSGDISPPPPPSGEAFDPPSPVHSQPISEPDGPAPADDPSSDTPEQPYEPTHSEQPVYAGAESSAVGVEEEMAAVEAAAAIISAAKPESGEAIAEARPAYDNGVDGLALRPVRAEPAPTSPLPTTPQLKITLHETDDEDADRERLHRIARALKKFPGEHEVRLVIQQLGGGQTDIAFGKADASAEFGVELAGLTGVDFEPFGL